MSSNISAPPFVRQYPLPELPPGRSYWRRPLFRAHDALQILPQHMLQQIHPNCSDSDEGRQRLTVFNLVAFTKPYHDAYGQILTRAKALGIKQREFDNHLRHLFAVGAVHTNLIRKGNRVDCKLTSAPFLTRAKECNDKEAKRRPPSTSKPKQPKSKPIKTPTAFLAESYVRKESEDGRRQARPVFPTLDCRVDFSDRTLRRIYCDDLQHGQSEETEAERKTRFTVFNVVAFGAFIDDDTGSVAHPEAGKGYRQTYGKIVRRARTFGIDAEEVKAHVKTMLDGSILHTMRTKGVLYITATPFLNTVERRPAPEDDEEERRAAPVATPEFMKEHMAPELEEGIGRWARRAMDKDVRAALHDESLRAIHEHYDTTEEGERSLVVFNVAAFGATLGSDGETISYPTKMTPSHMTYGALVRKCETFGIEREQVENDLHRMMQRGVLYTKKDQTSYYLIATPFLRRARILGDPDDWQRPKPPPRPWYAAPGFFDDFVKPMVPDTNERFARKQIPHSVREALARESLLLIHPQPDTEAGSTCLHLFDAIAFGGVFYCGDDDDDDDGDDNENDDGTGDSTAKNVIVIKPGATYGQIVRVGHVFGLSQEETDVHLLRMMQSGALCVTQPETHGQYGVHATPFLSDATLNPRYTSLQRKRQRLEGATDIHPRKIVRFSRENVVAGDELVCIGFGEEEPCSSGENGEPRNVDENWRDHFGIRREIACHRRNKRCFVCEARQEKQRVVVILNWMTTRVMELHTDGSLPLLSTRAVLNDMITDASTCCLCGGQFSMDPQHHVEDSATVLPTRPWAYSYNLKDPWRGKCLHSVDEIKSRGNIVHLVCNFAQNKYDYEEVVRVCRIIACRRDNDDDIATHCPWDQLPKRAREALNKRGHSHGLSAKETKQVYVRSQSRDVYTGMTWGSHASCDIRVDRYDSVHPLLRLSLDRIDVSVDDNSISNYQITLLIVNNLKNAFKESVVSEWLMNLKDLYAGLRGQEVVRDVSLL